VVSTLAKVGAGYQITLPSEVRRRLQIEKGDLLSIDIVEGRLVMTPQKEVSPARADLRRLVDLVGMGSGVFASPEAVDDFIAGERATWD
jgi:AbrB family looped-hinge helix DNA binding protein